MNESRLKSKNSCYLKPRTNVLWYLMRREMGLLQMNETSRLAQSVLCHRKVLKPEFADVPSGTRMVFIMAVSPNRRRLAAAHGDHTIRIYDLATGKEIQTCVGHPRTPWCIQFHPVYDHILASGCLGGEVRVWDLHAGTSLLWPRARDATAASLTFHPYEPVLAVACAHDVTFWNWTDMSRMMTWRFSTDHAKVRWIRFSPQGNALYTGTANRSTEDNMDQPTVSHIGEEGVHSELTPVYSYIREEWSRLQSSLAGWMSYGVGPAPSVSYVVRDNVRAHGGDRHEGRERRMSPTLNEARQAHPGLPSARQRPPLVTNAANERSEIPTTSGLRAEPLANATVVVDSRWRRPPRIDVITPRREVQRPVKVTGAPPHHAGIPSGDDLLRQQRRAELVRNLRQEQSGGEGEGGRRRYHMGSMLRNSVFQAAQARAAQAMSERGQTPRGHSRSAGLESRLSPHDGQPGGGQAQNAFSHATSHLLSRLTTADRAGTGNASSSGELPTRGGASRTVNIVKEKANDAARSGNGRSHAVHHRFARQRQLRKRSLQATSAARSENGSQPATDVHIPAPSTCSLLIRRHHRARRRQQTAALYFRKLSSSATADGARNSSRLAATQVSRSPARKTLGKRLRRSESVEVPSKHPRSDAGDLPVDNADQPQTSRAGDDRVELAAQKCRRQRGKMLKLVRVDLENDDEVRERPAAESMSISRVGSAPDSLNQASSSQSVDSSRRSDNSASVNLLRARLMGNQSSNSSAVLAANHHQPSETLLQHTSGPAVVSRDSTLNRPRPVQVLSQTAVRANVAPCDAPATPNAGSPGGAADSAEGSNRRSVIGALSGLDQAMPSGYPAGVPPTVRHVHGENQDNPSGHPGGDARWLNLETRQVAHRDYGVPILDQTVNMPRTLRRLINQTIAGLIFGRGDGAVASNILGVNYKIRRWDMRSTNDITVQIANNCVVKQCKIHNDSSVALSPDGSLLAAFVPTTNMPDQNVLSIYSTMPATLGQCLFTKMFGPNAITVDFSPVGDMVLVGLASRRTMLPDGIFNIAQVYRLAHSRSGEKSMELIRNVVYSSDGEQSQSMQHARSHVSINAAIWLPHPCVGFAFGTTTSEVFTVQPGVDVSEDAALQLRSVGTQTAAAAALTTSTETTRGSLNVNERRISWESY